MVGSSRPRVLVGVTGSIAAYRSPDLVKELVARGFDVRVILTPSAAELVSARVLETFSGAPVVKDRGPHTFSGSDPLDASQRLGAWADGILVYAASAHCLYRYARGLPEDTLTTELLGFSKKVILAPAMNPSMWEHPAVVENTRLLQERGVEFVGPISGRVACGESGVGHVAHLDEIADSLESLREKQSDLSAAWRGRRVLISAGPMRSRLDPVRYLQNRSSGLMGLELARAARRAGAQVTVLLGPVEESRRREFASFAVHSYEDAADYEAHLRDLLLNHDVFLSAAAVLDFSLEVSSQKRSRHSFGERATPEGSFDLNLKAQVVKDFVSEAVRWRQVAGRVSSLLIVAFAAETGDDAAILSRARHKLLEKGADALLVNPVNELYGPEAVDNRMWLLEPQNPEPSSLGTASKAQMSQTIVEALNSLLLAQFGPNLIQDLV